MLAFIVIVLLLWGFGLNPILPVPVVLAPLGGTLIRLRPRCNPKGNEQPHIDPVVTSFFAVLVRVYRIEAYLVLYFDIRAPQRICRSSKTLPVIQVCTRDSVRFVLRELLTVMSVPVLLSTPVTSTLPLLHLLGTSIIRHENHSAPGPSISILGTLAYTLLAMLITLRLTITTNR